MTSRREFLEGTALSALALSLPALPSRHLSDADVAPPPRGFLDLLRPPDGVLVQTATGDLTLTNGASGWTNNGVIARTNVRQNSLGVALSAPGVAVKRLHLRWRGRMSDARLMLGDAWERGYGDLEWRGWVPDRVMPWYMATHDGSLTHAYGVRTGARGV